MDVLKHLRHVLIEAREGNATYAEVAVKFGAGENAIRKFERGETAPRYSAIDDLVRAYAEATEVEAGALWDEAMRRAHDGPATGTNGSARELAPDSPPGRSAAAARRAKEQTARQDSGQGRPRSD